MRMPSEEADADGAELYDVPRGTCPDCGGGLVRHQVIGLPAIPVQMINTPPWVDWVGCMHPGYDRICEECGHTWTAEDPGQATAPR